MLNTDNVKKHKEEGRKDVFDHIWVRYVLYDDNILNCDVVGEYNLQEVFHMIVQLVNLHGTLVLKLNK